MNHTLQEIFEIIENWDWFGEPKKDWKIRQFHIAREMADGEVYKSFSLPDLLANPSWTDACGLSQPQILVAFVTLRNESEQACLNYIFKTMKI